MHAIEVARLVTTKPELALAGATGYEGTICDDRTPACLDEVRAFLDRLAALTARLRADGLVETEETWVSAGGSAFFDLVVERLGPSGGIADRVLLRSGSYVAHDVGMNERLVALRPPRAGASIPLGDRGVGRRALTSRAGLAILGFGRRDVPFDQDLPMPFTLRRRLRRTRRRRRRPGRRAAERPARLLPGRPDVAIEPGDLVGCGVSHPCTAFDKWRVIPVLDDDDHVIDAVATYF